MSRQEDGSVRALPAGWRWVRLGEVCEIQAGQVDPRETQYRDLPHVNGENIEAGTGRLLPTRSAAEDRMISGKYLFEAGQVLYSKLRPYLRKAVVAASRGLCSADMYPLAPDTAVLTASFLLLLLLSDEFTDYAVAESLRARMPKLNRVQLFAYTAPLPPLAEQQRLAALLREQLAAVDRARRAAEARLEAVRALPPAVLRREFEGAEARGWRRVPLGEISALLPSRSVASDGDTEVRAITTACLSELGFLPSGIKPARMAAEDAGLSLVAAGEVLVARSNTPELVGRAALVPPLSKAAVASDLTIRIRSGADLAPGYLAGYLSWLFVRGYWRDRAGGASGSMKKITRTAILGLPVAVPPRARQETIAATLEGWRAAITAAQAAAEAQLSALHALPAALLRRAFAGEI